MPRATDSAGQLISSDGELIDLEWITLAHTLVEIENLSAGEARLQTFPEFLRVAQRSRDMAKQEREIPSENIHPEIIKRRDAIRRLRLSGLNNREICFHHEVNSSRSTVDRDVRWLKTQGYLKKN